MIRWTSLLVAALALTAVVPARVEAQDAVIAQPDASVGAALRDLASRAALVFAGQVVSIQRSGAVVQIVFRVDTPVIGQVGSTYTLREWAGMWPPGQWRYTVGERALVFLHGASQAGFSSAVDGGEGVVPLVRGSDGTPLLDARRLSTRVLRQIGQPLPDESASAISLAEATQIVANWKAPTFREPSRRPLPPGLDVVPKRTSTKANLPSALIHLNPSQHGTVQVMLQRGSDASN